MISEVYNMDCMEYLKDFPDNWFDLAVVDPPYGIGADNFKMGSHPTRSKNDGYGSGPGISTAVKLKNRLNSGGGKLKNRLLNNSNTSWDIAPNEDYFIELRRVSKAQIIWGGNYFNLGISRCWILWDKLQPWENFSQFEMAWTSFDKPTAVFKYSNTGGANRDKKIHPTEKPIKLYDWTFQKYIPEGGRVLDTHLGSGSSRIAADKSGNIDFYGTEIDSDYFNDHIKRWNIYKSQLKLQLY